MEYYPKLMGEQCYLAPIDVADAGLYTGWINDMAVAINLTFAVQQLTLDRERELLEKMSKNGDYLFGIVICSTDQLIGNCGLTDLDWVNRTADLGIFIGEKEAWGHGYGREAIHLLLDYAFNVLNLHNIRLCVFDYNERAIACYEKCGFRLIGRRRQAKRIAGQVYDIVYMDMLASEFRGGYIRQLLPASGLDNPPDTR